MTAWALELQAAVEASRAAAAEHRRFADGDLGVRSKSVDHDLVTKADLAAERAIRQVLLGAFPDDAILGEEEGHRGEGRRVWIVDPLDGTTNYAHGIPYWAVSIALQVDGELVAGLVLDVARDELFTAIAGAGARRNGAPIAVAAADRLGECVVATGFAPPLPRRAENLELFSRVLPRVRAIRRPGAAALDLAAVACGRYGGFWELYLSPWDVAAGTLLVREAGGRVTNEAGDEAQLGDRVIVASNGRCHDELLGALAG